MSKKSRARRAAQRAISVGGTAPTHEDIQAIEALTGTKAIIPTSVPDDRLGLRIPQSRQMVEAAYHKGFEEGRLDERDRHAKLVPLRVAFTDLLLLMTQVDTAIQTSRGKTLKEFLVTRSADETLSQRFTRLMRIAGEVRGLDWIPDGLPSNIARRIGAVQAILNTPSEKELGRVCDEARALFRQAGGLDAAFLQRLDTFDGPGRPSEEMPYTTYLKRRLSELIEECPGAELRQYHYRIVGELHQQITAGEPVSEGAKQAYQRLKSAKHPMKIIAAIRRAIGQ